MFLGWGRTVRRRIRRRAVERTGGTRLELVGTVFLALLLAAGTIVYSGLRLRPTAAEIARTQARNTVHELVEEAVIADLEARSLGYSDFVAIQRDDSGTITALSTDMALLNSLRSQLLEQILQHLENVDVSLIQIPLGSLLDIDFLWAKGPYIHLHSMTVGTVSAEFESEFISAGVNQTMHRIWLDIRVPLILMLPGDRVETEADTRLCVAETVIVGEVPQTYLRNLT